MVEFQWGDSKGVQLGVTTVPLPVPEVLGVPPKLHACPLHATLD